MNTPNHYVFLLGTIMLLGASVGFSYDLVFAEVDDVPDRPVDLEADAISSSQIDLSWDEPTDDNNNNNIAITGYKIEMRTIDNSSYDTVVDDTESTSRTYSHTGLDADTDYIYRVSAINSEGVGEPSREVRVTTLSSDDDDDNDSSTPDDVPDRPVDLEADAISSSQIDLSWDEPTDDNNNNNIAITGYKIEMRTIDNSSYDTVVDDTESTSRTYSHTGLDADTDYIYRVSAINSEGVGEPSREVRVTTLSSDDDDDNDSSTPDDVPDRPVDLEADAISSSQIDLSWDEPTDDNNNNNIAITGYKIEMRTIDNSSYDTVVDDTESTSRTYSHTGLDADTDYIYRVSAINSEGVGEPSREVRVTTLSSDDDINNTSQQNSSASSPSDNNTSQQNSSRFLTI